MKQIHAGGILDVESVLTSYEIHPIQQKNYALNHSRTLNKLFQKPSLLTEKITVKLNLND